jgi:hypothetical protein
MPTKISKLTPEQLAQMPQWVDKWTKIGLSTEPANFEKAIQAGLECYKLINAPPPGLILTFDSPYACVLGGIYGEQFFSVLMNQVENQTMNQVWDQVENQVRNQVRDQVDNQVMNQTMNQVWDQVGNQVDNQVRIQVRNQVRSQVESQVWDQVGNQVRNQVRSQVESQVWNQVWNQVRDQVGNQIENQVENQIENQVRDQVGNAVYQYRGSQLWAGWYAYVSFLRDVCNWKNDSLSSFYWDEQLALHSGFTWWHPNVFSVSNRPELITFNQNKVLHNAKGPAIKYRDGWSIYAWNGVNVPQEWIEKPNDIDIKKELSGNIERRRALTEIIGWPKIFASLQATKLQQDEFGILYQANLPDAPKQKFVKVLCGTGREFIIPVPPEVQTAAEAVAKTYNVDITKYQPEVRT